MKSFLLTGNIPRDKQRFLRLFFIFLFVLPNLSFRFSLKKEKVLPHPYWVEAQNRDAFQGWHESVAGEVSPYNFVFVPLQDTRRRALLEEAMIFKVPAFPKQEEVPALNALKTAMLETKEHQVEINYKELLLQNAAYNTNEDLKQVSKQYQVKLKKIKFKKADNSIKIKKELFKKFHAPKNTAFKAADPVRIALSLSGFSLKGQWRDGFNPGNTREQPFNRNEAEISVPMMLKTGYHGYLEEDDFQALDLRYGDGKLSLLVFMPPPGVSLASFYADLNFENWYRWTAGFIERQGAVRIPRFKIETLSSDDSQLAVFETAEKGGKDSLRYDMTEVLGTEERFEFNADRPFFFVVRDNETDLIFLMGQFTGVSAPDHSTKKLPA